MSYLEPEKYPERYSDRRKNEEQISNLQNKLNSQSKLLNLMQEYINLLKNKLKKYNPNKYFP